jgi:hypothetical protein
MRRARVRPLLVLLSTAVANLALVADVGNLVRPLVVLWFLLICPGIVVVGLLSIDDWIAELVLAVALSLAAETLLALAMLYSGMWAPPTAMAVLSAVTIAGASIQAWTAIPTSRGPMVGRS